MSVHQWRCRSALPQHPRRPAGSRGPGQPGPSLTARSPSQVPGRFFALSRSPRARCGRRARSARSPRWAPRCRRYRAAAGPAGCRPGLQDRVDPAPRRLDLVAAHEQRLVAADDVHEQPLIGVRRRARRRSWRSSCRAARGAGACRPGPGSLIISHSLTPSSGCRRMTSWFGVDRPALVGEDRDAGSA